MGTGDAIPYELLWDAKPSKKLVERYLSKAITYLAVCEGETVGVCVLVSINEETIGIKNLAVTKKLQGKGIGKELIAYAFEIAQQQGYKTVLIVPLSRMLDRCVFIKRWGLSTTTSLNITLIIVSGITIRLFLAMA